MRIDTNIVNNSLNVVFLDENRIDTTNLKNLKENFNTILEEEVFESLVLDLDTIEFIDSSGLAFIINIYKKLNAENKELKIINVCSFVNKVFTITKIGSFIDIDVK